MRGSLLTGRLVLITAPLIVHAALEASKQIRGRRDRAPCVPLQDFTLTNGEIKQCAAAPYTCPSVFHYFLVFLGKCVPTCWAGALAYDITALLLSSGARIDASDQVGRASWLMRHTCPIILQVPILTLKNSPPQVCELIQLLKVVLETPSENLPDCTAQLHGVRPHDMTVLCRRTGIEQLTLLFHT